MKQKRVKSKFYLNFKENKLIDRQEIQHELSLDIIKESSVRLTIKTDA